MNKRVLIVDDERDIVEAIQFRLELEGLECIVAYDGEEGLDKARNEHPDIIILDVMLPKMVGHKVADILKRDETYNKIPILMLSARVQPIDIKLGEKTGVEEYITKPFDLSILIDKIKGYITI